MRDALKVSVAFFAITMAGSGFAKILDALLQVVAANEELENHDRRDCKSEPQQKPEFKKEEFETLYDIRFTADQKFMDLFKKAALAL